MHYACLGFGPIGIVVVVLSISMTLLAPRPDPTRPGAQVGPEYPMAPPSIRFVTKVFHPNVNFDSGEICLDILKREWSPAWSLQVLSTKSGWGVERVEPRMLSLWIRHASICWHEVKTPHSLESILNHYDTRTSTLSEERPHTLHIRPVVLSHSHSQSSNTIHTNNKQTTFHFLSLMCGTPPLPDTPPPCLLCCLPLAGGMPRDNCTPCTS